MQFLLHIGSPKTGTTAIQQYLSTLSSPRINYIAAHKESNLFFRFLRPEILRTLSPRLVAALIRETRSTLLSRATPDAMNIISAEILSFCNPKYISQIFDGHKLTCVCYIRNELEAITSNYSTQVKRSYRPPDFNEYITLRLQRSNRNIIEPWFAEFGESLCLEVYDKKKLRNGDIVCDFSEKFLQQQAPPKSENCEPRRLNFSLSDKVIAFKRLLHTQEQNMILTANDIIIFEELSKNFGAPFYIPELFRNKLENRLTEDCRAYSRKYLNQDQLFDYSAYPYSKKELWTGLPDDEFELMKKAFFELRRRRSNSSSDCG